MRLIPKEWLVGVAAALAVATGCSKDSEAAPSQKQPATQQAQPAQQSAVMTANHVDGKNFKLDAQTQGDCKTGDACVLVLRLEATGDYHINKEYPYKFKAQETANVEFQGTDAGGRNIFSKAAGDFSIDAEKIATMKVKFKPSAKGALTIAGTYKLSVCSVQNCQLESQEIAASVTVH